MSPFEKKKISLVFQFPLSLNHTGSDILINDIDVIQHLCHAILVSYILFCLWDLIYDLDVLCNFSYWSIFLSLSPLLFKKDILQRRYTWPCWAFILFTETCPFVRNWYKCSKPKYSNSKNCSALMMLRLD